MPDYRQIYRDQLRAKFGDVLTTQDVAEMAGCERNYVISCIDRGQLKARKGVFRGKNVHLVAPNHAADFAKKAKNLIKRSRSRVGINKTPDMIQGCYTRQAVEKASGKAKCTTLKHIKLGILKARRFNYKNRPIWLVKPQDLEDYLKFLARHKMARHLPPPGFIKFYDLAKKAGRHPEFVYDLHKRGELAAEKTESGVLMVSQAEAELFLKTYSRKDLDGISAAEACRKYGLTYDKIYYAIKHGLITASRSKAISSGAHGRGIYLLDENDIKWLASLNKADKLRIFRLDSMMRTGEALKGLTEDD